MSREKTHTHFPKPHLMMASKEGHIRIVEALLNAGADVNSAGKGGDTALTLAQIGGHAEIIRLLQKAGIDN